MCEFCVKHGEGKKWYLQARNYSADLLSDARRRDYIRSFFADGAGQLREAMHGLERLSSAPAVVRRLVSGQVTRRQKKDHFGQVVPIEDIERILEFATGVVRVACVCRQATRGTEARYCFGVAAPPGFGAWRGLVGAGYGDGPDTEGLERLTPAEALDLMRGMEQEGLMHSVWTFITPFIGGICNCDRSDCLAMQSTVVHDVKVMFRAEYVAEVDWEKCTGCRACMRLCQFGAMGFSAAARKAYLDQRRCYGCGVCRAACPEQAISLVPRASVPAVAALW